MNKNNKILLYTTVDGKQKLEVNLQDDTVWLSLDQIADLFQRNKSTISRHIKNIFKEGELLHEATVTNNIRIKQPSSIQRNSKNAKRIHNLHSRQNSFASLSEQSSLYPLYKQVKTLNKPVTLL